MVEFNKIAELFDIASHGMKWAAKKPTENSLARIERELGLEIPDAYRRIAVACPNYGGLLNGLGDDYESNIHILNMNRVFHDEALVSPALPEHYVLISRGHDGDCDCWDLRAKSTAGEHPIVHVRLEGGSHEDDPAVVNVSDVQYETFCDYLVKVALWYGDKIYPGTDPAVVARAKELIREISGQMTKK